MAIPTHIDDDLAVQLAKGRAQLLTDLAASVNALQRAATTLQHLRGSELYDIELVDGRDGCDIAAFLDDSIRCSRAAYGRRPHNPQQGEGLVRATSCPQDVEPHHSQPNEGSAARSSLNRNSDRVDRE